MLIQTFSRPIPLERVPTVAASTVAGAALGSFFCAQVGAFFGGVGLGGLASLATGLITAPILVPAGALLGAGLGATQGAVFGARFGFDSAMKEP